ncbi:MAG TPA: hypothetical protein VIF14_09125 [Alphaproteobacteria bacterium]|jgi:hypothetical protein
MKKLATVTAALVALFAIGAESPANAALGQCFDAYGRPVGPPHSTDNPPYGLICSVYAQGGQCTHVQPGWAENNCGVAPRYSRGYPQYNYNRDYRYDYGRRHSRGATPQERELRRLQRVDPQPNPAYPPLPDRGQPNNAR